MAMPYGQKPSQPPLPPCPPPLPKTARPPSAGPVNPPLPKPSTTLDSDNLNKASEPKSAPDSAFTDPSVKAPFANFTNPAFAVKASPSGSQVDTSLEDWQCHKCQTPNFSFRLICKSCGSKKIESLASKTLESIPKEAEPNLAKPEMAKLVRSYIRPKHGSSDGSALDSRPRGPGFESRWIL